MFEIGFPRSIVIDYTLIPNHILNFEFMSVFMVKNLVVALNPNGPHDNATKEEPNVEPRFEFLLNAFAQDAILPTTFMK